jgi:hypothetical protein
MLLIRQTLQVAGARCNVGGGQICVRLADGSAFYNTPAVLDNLSSLRIAANGSNEYAYQSEKLMLSKSCHRIEQSKIAMSDRLMSPVDIHSTNESCR